MYGKDKYGDPFPPILSQQLCEDIGVGGISNGDTDKECISQTKIPLTLSLLVLII